MHPHPELSANPLTETDAFRVGLWALLFFAVAALVLFEQGVLTGGTPLLHELFHDSRHLLGVPCH